MTVALRPVDQADLGDFFRHEQDEVALQMAAFTPKNSASRHDFDEHWGRIMADPEVEVRTIVCDGAIGGHIASFRMFGDLEVTYWIDKDLWGRGVATEALGQFLGLVDERPIHARTAKDNLGSIRVLEKCGFVVVGEDKGFANARGAEIEELVLRLG